MECLTLLRITVSVALLIAVTFPTIFAAVPVITNVHGEQRPGTELVDVYYDLDAGNSTSVAVRLEVSADGGANWTVPVVSVSQSVGNAVSSGNGKHILWNAGADWNGHVSTDVRFKVTASDLSTLQSGLLAYYPFDGNANDASGNGNSGFVYGAVLSNDRFGNVNSAYDFDGHSSYIRVPNNGTMNLTDDFSIGVWIKPRTVSGINDIVTKHTAWINSDGSWAFRLVQTADFVAMPYLDRGGPINSGSVIPVGVWTHTSFTYSRITGKWVFYINGAEVASGACSYTISETNLPLLIGCEGYPGSDPAYGFFFDGSIDELRIYNRILTASEVKTLYNYR